MGRPRLRAACVPVLPKKELSRIGLGSILACELEDLAFMVLGSHCAQLTLGPFEQLRRTLLSYWTDDRSGEVTGAKALLIRTTAEAHDPPNLLAPWVLLFCAPINLDVER